MLAGRPPVALAREPSVHEGPLGTVTSQISTIIEKHEHRIDARAKRSGDGKLPRWRKNRDRIDGAALSIEMGGSVVLGWYLGKLFDEHFVTSPWGMIFFLLAGIVAASKAVLRYYHSAKKVMAQKEPGIAVSEAMDRAATRPPEVSP
jgi:F0F1-type ATP synthase assembly protein I